MGAYMNALREEASREDLLQQIERLLEEKQRHAWRKAEELPEEEGSKVEFFKKDGDRAMISGETCNFHSWGMLLSTKEWHFFSATLRSHNKQELIDAGVLWREIGPLPEEIVEDR